MQISSTDIQFYPLGDTALVLQIGAEMTTPTQQTIFAISTFLDEYSFEGLVEYVPAYTSVTFFYDPLLISYTDILKNLQEMLEEITLEDPLSSGTIIDIPVLYGADSGPDLESVAEHCRLTVPELIALHTEPEYLVHMIGFAPGFPYLGGMNKALETPRRDQPRAMVPAGSVGIAGQQTGVYPIATPGGWQIIGRTPLKLFDLDRVMPALLKSGDRLRFSAITEIEFERIANGY